MSTRKTAAKGTTQKSSGDTLEPGAALNHGSLQEALQTLMQPLAVLAVARGMPFATVEEMLKKAFVEAAKTAHSKAGPNRLVSRISTVTGLNRREVTRL